MMGARGEDVDFAIHLDLKDLIFRSPQKMGLLNRKEFCKATGLTSHQLQRLLEGRLPLPLKKNRFDQEDVRIGEMFARGLSRGLRESRIRGLPTFATL